jgi:hypothetical protein
MPRDGELGELLCDLGGRPPFVPSIEQRHAVTVLRTNGCSERVIARLLRINRRTLRKHFKTELEDAREILVAALGAVVVHAGLNGDWRAAVSWLSRFGGPEWVPTERRLHGGIPGAPPIEVNARARVIIVPRDEIEIGA